MSQNIIRKIRFAHCKKGPSICEQCREMNEERMCLLEIFPPGTGEMQRRLIEVEIEGEKVWREYDILRSFEDEKEAGEYADTHNIEDIVL